MMRRGHPPYDPVYARPVKPGEVVYNVYPSQRPVDRVPNIHRSSTLRSSPKYVDPLVAEIPPTQHRPKYVDPPVVERLPAQPTYVEHPAMKQSARRPSTRYMDPSVMKQVAPVSMTPPERAHQPEQRPGEEHLIVFHLYTNHGRHKRQRHSNRPSRKGRVKDQRPRKSRNCVRSYLAVSVLLTHHTYSPARP